MPASIKNQFSEKAGYDDGLKDSPHILSVCALVRDRTHSATNVTRGFFVFPGKLNFEGSFRDIYRYR